MLGILHGGRGHGDLDRRGLFVRCQMLHTLRVCHLLYSLHLHWHCVVGVLLRLALTLTWRGDWHRLIHESRSRWSQGIAVLLNVGFLVWRNDHGVRRLRRRIRLVGVDWQVCGRCRHRYGQIGLRDAHCHVWLRLDLLCRVCGRAAGSGARLIEDSEASFLVGRFALLESQGSVLSRPAPCDWRIAPGSRT